VLFAKDLRASFYFNCLTMSAIKFLGLAALALAAPLEERAKKPKSFLKELGNSTWVLGNDIWNVTQNRQYANKLMYKGADRVKNAVGHYVSYSAFMIPNHARETNGPHRRRCFRS
jgi:hypothetical protein